MGIKDWFGGDKKKAAYREKVKEAVSDGKLSNTDLQGLAQLRAELDVTEASDDKTSLRRELYNDAVDAARSKGQISNTGVHDLAKIQKFLALRDDQIEKTKIEVNRLRTLTEIRRGNLPVVPTSNVALRGVPHGVGRGGALHPRGGNVRRAARRTTPSGLKVDGGFSYAEGSVASQFMAEDTARPLGEGQVIITNRRLVLKTGDGRAASVQLLGRDPVLPLQRGHPAAEDDGQHAAALPLALRRDGGDRGRAAREDPAPRSHLKPYWRLRRARAAPRS